MFFKLIFTIFIQDKQDTVIWCNNRRVDVYFILELKDGFLCDLFILRKVINLHLIVFLYSVFILNFLANSSLKHEASLGIAHFNNFLDNFIRQTMDNNFLLIFPNQDVSFLKIDANQTSTICDV